MSLAKFDFRPYKKKYNSEDRVEMVSMNRCWAPLLKYLTDNFQFIWRYINYGIHITLNMFEISLMEKNYTVKISHKMHKIGLLKIRLVYWRFTHLEFCRSLEFRREILSILVTYFPFNEITYIIFILYKFLYLFFSSPFYMISKGLIFSVNN